MRQTARARRLPLAVVMAALIVLSACDMPEKPDGADQEGFERIGDQLRAHGDDEGAADFYVRSLQMKPKDAAVRIKLADLIEAHGVYPNALMEYQEGLKIDPDNADFMRGEGRIYLKLNRPQDARDAYEAALQQNSSDSKALDGLGIALDYLKQHEAAQKAYRSALDNDPQDMTAAANLGHSYVLSGGYEEAIKLLEPYAQDKNATPALRQNLAEAYALAGMDADAERMLRIDLPAPQVERDMAYYRAERTKLNVKPRLYADLGSYATEAMADAHMDQVKDRFGDDMAGLLIAVMPEVKAAGGTPNFALQVTGFANAGKVHTFCDKLKDSDIGCKAITGS